MKKYFNINELQSFWLFIKNTLPQHSSGVLLLLMRIL